MKYYPHLLFCYLYFDTSGEKILLHHSAISSTHDRLGFRDQMKYRK